MKRTGVDILNTISQLSGSAIKMLLAPATMNGPVDLRVPLDLSGPEQRDTILYAVGDLARWDLVTVSGDVMELTPEGRAAAALVRRDPIAVLHAQFAAANAEGASSNDVVQMLDDLLTAYGQPTVMYAPATPPAADPDFKTHTCWPGHPGKPKPFGAGLKLPRGTCARCDELNDGAPRREAPAEIRNRGQIQPGDDGYQGYPSSGRIFRHFANGGPHDRGECGPVCTFGDW